MTANTVTTATTEKLGKTAIQRYSPPEILTRATGFVNTYDFTINPYSGCSFGCSYCYAAFFPKDERKRDTWGQWVSIKENARHSSGDATGALNGKRIYMSTVTDPYQPVERKELITRGILEELARNTSPNWLSRPGAPS